MAAGDRAKSGDNSISIGYSSACATTESVLIGAYAQATKPGSISIGSDSYWGYLPGFGDAGGKAAATTNTDAIQIGRMSASNIIKADKQFQIWGGVADGGLRHDGQTGTLNVSNITAIGAINVAGSNGWSGTFLTGDLKTVTVTNGVIIGVQ